MNIKKIFQEFGDCFDNCVTLVDLGLEDQPLIYVNQKFLSLTGYDKIEVINSNCRFLRGRETNPDATKRIKNAIQSFEPVCQDIMNYKKDGSMFGNRLVLLPFSNKDSRFMYGMQTEIPINEVSQDEVTITNDELSDRVGNPFYGIALHHELMARKNTPVRPREVKEMLSQCFLEIKSYIISV